MVNFRRRKLSEWFGAEVERGGSYPESVWTIETLAESYKTPEGGLISGISSALKPYVLSGREQSSCLTGLSRANVIKADFSYAQKYNSCWTAWEGEVPSW